MSERLDCVVIGAGAVGLATARALALRGRQVTVLESETSFGTATSARNSEVIHAGLYYPPGSLKSRLCVAGKAMLYAYLSQRSIAHRRCGKLVVATDAREITALTELENQARTNGCDDITWLSKKEAQALEPHLRCQAALLSPGSGIFDSHAFMLSLLGDLEAAGGTFVVAAPVSGGRVTSRGILLRVGIDAPEEVTCDTVINCAGLEAQRVIGSIDGFDKSHIPQRFICKGSYFTLMGKAPFSRLVYPLPQAAGLGIHYSFDLDGRGRFGPDVQWVEDIDYRVDPDRAPLFDAAIRRYWPTLPPGSLAPGYAGIRPKLGDADAPPQDFRIDGPQEHGIAGLVNLFGIESPGLTASLALGEQVAELVC